MWYFHSIVLWVTTIWETFYTHRGRASAPKLWMQASLGGAQALVFFENSAARVKKHYLIKICVLTDNRGMKA